MSAVAAPCPVHCRGGPPVLVNRGWVPDGWRDGEGAATLQPTAKQQLPGERTTVSNLQVNAEQGTHVKVGWRGRLGTCCTRKELSFCPDAQPRVPQGCAHPQAPLALPLLLLQREVRRVLEPANAQGRERRLQRERKARQGRPPAPGWRGWCRGVHHRCASALCPLSASLLYCTMHSAHCRCGHLKHTAWALVTLLSSTV